MLVVKRDGKKEPVAFDKITARIKKLCYGFNPEHVDPVVVAQKVVTGVFDGVSTAQLDDLASETAAFLTTQHPDYGKLAARIAVSNMHKQTSKSFSETMYKLHGYINPKTGEHGPLISDELKGIIEDHEDQLNAAIVYDRDFEYDYFGFKTLEKSYLLKMGSEVRPHHSPSPLALLASASSATPASRPPPSPSPHPRLPPLSPPLSPPLAPSDSDSPLCPTCSPLCSPQVVERPQQMLMRVALGIHLRDIDSAIETYNLMSEKWFTHASPTMFNAGTKTPQMSSCFLLTMQALHTHRLQPPAHRLHRLHAACTSPARRLHTASTRLPHRLQPLPPLAHCLHRLRAACAPRVCRAALCSLHRCAGRLDRGHLQHAQAVRADLQGRGRRRPQCLQHPRERQLHPRHQRPVQRVAPHVTRLQ